MKKKLIGMHLTHYASFSHAGIFYPYGSDGDEYVEQGDDNNSTEIHLPQPFPFRSFREDTLYVCCIYDMKATINNVIALSPCSPLKCIKGGGDPCTQ